MIITTPVYATASYIEKFEKSTLKMFYSDGTVKVLEGVTIYFLNWLMKKFHSSN